MSIKVTFLGFNSAIPTAHSHPTAQIVKVAGDYLLIDCGEGTQVQMRKAKIKFSKINHIFISHMHGDHVFGLIGLLSTFHLLGRKKELHIFGPKGIKLFIEHQLKLTYSYNQYPIFFHELSSMQSELIFENKNFKVYTIPLHHRTYCNGYLVVEQEKLRKLNIDAIKKIPEIKTCDYFNLKQGKDFILSDSNFIKNEYLTLPPSKSKKYAFCSDTMYKPDIVQIICHADLLYHEATFTEELRELAKATGHSTAKEAALIAKEAKVNKLIIGHFSNRYKNYNELLSEARNIFEQSYLPQNLLEIKI